MLIVGALIEKKALAKTVSKTGFENGHLIGSSEESTKFSLRDAPKPPHFRRPKRQGTFQNSRPGNRSLLPRLIGLEPLYIWNRGLSPEEFPPP